MKAEKKCCVAGCGVDSEILHRFPNPTKHAERFRTWIYNIGGDILGKDNEYIFKYRRVCHLHFENKFHTRSKMLSKNAVPTLNLSRSFSVERQTHRQITEQVTNLPPGIPSTSGLDSEILHRFPNPSKDAERFRTWIYNIGGDILGKDNEYIFKYSRVCHLHFENKFHTWSKMLSKNAVPTLNLSRSSLLKDKPIGKSLHR